MVNKGTLFFTEVQQVMYHDQMQVDCIHAALSSMPTWLFLLTLPFYLPHYNPRDNPCVTTYKPSAEQSHSASAGIGNSLPVKEVYLIPVAMKALSVYTFP